jgi:hypothetical protein
MSQSLELIEAAKEGDTETLARLIETGADLHEQDEHGWTPLNWSAGSGHLEAVKLLLEHGADVTKTGRDNRTPLMIAKAAGHEKVAELLTEAEQEKGVWVDPRKTRPYCKAYHLGELRKFSEWEEKEAAEADGSGGDDALTDKSIVYVHQDFTVTRSMWHGEDLVFDDVTPEWRKFCEQQLSFAIPEDIL